MPTFPRYQSKGQITTQTPSVQAPTDNSSQITEAVGQLGGVVQEAAVKWQGAIDTIQKTTATANFKSGMLDIENRAVNDPDYNNSDQYFKEIEKLRTDSLKGFTSKAAENAAAMEFAYDAKVSQIKIQNLYKKKMIDVGQVSTMKLIDSEVGNPTADSPRKIQALLDEQISAGIFSQEQAYKIYKDSVQNIGAFDVANDPATQEGQSQVLAELRKGDKGKYSEIPAEDRLALIKASQQRIFNNNQTFKRDTEDASNLRSNTLIDKIASGEASIKDIEAEMAIPEESGGIKRSQLLTFQRAAQRGITGDLNRMLQEKTPDKDPTKRAKAVKQYLDLIDNFIDSDSDQWKAKEMLAKAYEDGSISPKEMQFLNNLKQDLKDIEFNRSTSPVASAIRGVKDFFGFQSNAPDEDLARSIKTLVGQIQGGTSPENAMRMVLQTEVLSRIPDFATYPETGKLKRDANGNVIRVFPDGTYIDEPPQGKGKK